MDDVTKKTMGSEYGTAYRPYRHYYKPTVWDEMPVPFRWMLLLAAIAGVIIGALC